ncbi:hypothetical protein XBFM1_1110006 [Xenorhabdus bovienii str. feltiae Moldova]|uniref:Uncharacterized protein n=1 Tax=Xenorhabdus bovienii str. feltiae Moldova TaxID=1398200 RepID=A0A077NMY8_XENBV|nr:hypothetical protein XBFM1_1110006 [Xenorhabdus bovienii str. feltiae Moldova]
MMCSPYVRGCGDKPHHDDRLSGKHLTLTPNCRGVQVKDEQGSFCSVFPVCTGINC